MFCDRAAPATNRYRDRYRNIMVFSHELQKNHLDRISAILTRHESWGCFIQKDIPAKQLGMDR